MRRVYRLWRYVASVTGAAVLFQTSGCAMDTEALGSTLNTALSGALQAWLTALLSGTT